jgi:molybdopterin molybdotransferase
MPVMAGKQVTLEHAQEFLCDAVSPVAEPESCSLLEAMDRIAFEDIRADLPIPSFDSSPVDGYALRHEDSKGACPERPVRFPVTRLVFAGGRAPLPLGPGEAARVMTGAMIPQGADCVIRQEDTDRGEKFVSVYKQARWQENFSFCGENIRKGQLLVSRGQQLNFAHVGLAAGQGHAEIQVFRRPRVAVMACGDELTQQNDALLTGKIYDISTLMLLAKLKSLGMHPVIAENTADNVSALCERILALLGDNDFVITTGGTSEGQHDFMPAVLDKIGGTCLFRGLAMHSGKQVIAMRIEEKILLCLSGNPFSAAANFALLGKPALCKLAGHSQFFLQRQKGIAGDFFHKPSPLRRLVPAKITGQDVSIPPQAYATAMLASLTECNCMVDILPPAKPVKPGDTIDVILC